MQLSSILSHLHPEGQCWRHDITMPAVGSRVADTGEQIFSMSSIYSLLFTPISKIIFRRLVLSA